MLHGNQTHPFVPNDHLGSSSNRASGNDFDLNSFVMELRPSTPPISQRPPSIVIPRVQPSPPYMVSIAPTTNEYNPFSPIPMVSLSTPPPSSGGDPYQPHPSPTHQGSRRSMNMVESPPPNGYNPFSPQSDQSSLFSPDYHTAPSSPMRYTPSPNNPNPRLSQTYASPVVTSSLSVSSEMSPYPSPSQSSSPSPFSSAYNSPLASPLPSPSPSPPPSTSSVTGLMKRAASGPLLDPLPAFPPSPNTSKRASVLLRPPPKHHSRSRSVVEGVRRASGHYPATPVLFGKQEEYMRNRDEILKKEEQLRWMREKEREIRERLEKEMENRYSIEEKDLRVMVQQELMKQKEEEKKKAEKKELVTRHSKMHLPDSFVNLKLDEDFESDTKTTINQLKMNSPKLVRARSRTTHTINRNESATKMKRGSFINTVKNVFTGNKQDDRSSATMMTRKEFTPSSPDMSLLPVSPHKDMGLGKACTIIQRVVRGWLVRRKFREEGSFKRKALTELIVSEREFCVEMQNMMKVYLQPIKSSLGTAKVLMTVEEIQVVFGNIEELVSLTKSLITKLEQIFDKWTVFKPISIPFVKLNVEQMYSKYVSEYQNAVRCLQAALDKKRKSPLRKYVKELDKKYHRDLVKSSGYYAGSYLFDILKLPVDHLSRHVYYLKGILLWTLPCHSDMVWIHQCIEKCEKLRTIGNAAHQQNPKKKNSDSMSAVVSKIDINSKLLLIPNRTFVREGELRLMDCKTTKSKEAHYFLFNDILLLCERTGTFKTKYKPKIRIELKGARSMNISDNHSFGGQTLQNAWEIQTPSQPFIMFTSTEEEKEKLLKELEKHIHAQNLPPQ